MSNLKLCLKHKQEPNQSHFAEHNCDYCKQQERLKTAMEIIQDTACVGVDFGHGEYNLSNETIYKARRFLSE